MTESFKESLLNYLKEQAPQEPVNAEAIAQFAISKDNTQAFEAMLTSLAIEDTVGTTNYLQHQIMKSMNINYTQFNNIEYWAKVGHRVNHLADYYAEDIPHLFFRITDLQEKNFLPVSNNELFGLIKFNEFVQTKSN